MDDATRGEVAAWLAIARRDLDSAKRLLIGDPPYRDTAAYHCQQAAEKALKCFLTATGTPFPKTHDLTTLVTLAAATDAAAKSWEEAAILLTPYATLYRYPDAFPEPGDDDLAEAITSAENLLREVEEILSVRR
jgi:HEPN domain-containing protein